MHPQARNLERVTVVPRRANWLSDRLNPFTDQVNSDFG